MQVRPLRADEAEEAHLLSARTFAALDRVAALRPPPPTPESRARGTHRVAHLQRTDPDGAWAAEQDGRLVGVALATVREGLWFLSLLVVDPDLQGAGTGKRLLEQSLRTAEQARGAWILSSPDPRALRRYALAGFTLEPGYAALGPVDRSRLPAVPDVREGDWERDGGLVEDVARAQRGAGLGPDLAAMRQAGARLLVTDTARGRGFAVLLPSGPRPLGATSTASAQDLLRAGLAEAGGDASVEFLTARQGWAVDVVVAAGMAPRPAASVCRRGDLGPMSPYLPSGAYG